MADRPPHPMPDDGSRPPDGERERLVAAASRAAAEHGYHGLTIERITDYAGVGREVFDLHFESREQSLLAAQEVFIERLLREATAACESSRPWPLRLRAALRAVLSWLDENASLARVFTVEAGSADLAIAERQIAALDEFARLLRDGRRDHPAAAALPEVTERVVVGGVVWLLRQRLLREEPAAPPSLEREIAELLLMPYLGAGEARRVAAEPLAG